MASDFQESLFGCFTDIPSFLLVAFIPCGCGILQSCTVKKVTGDTCLVPYCMPVLLGCIGSAINRGEIRTVLKINGNFYSDFLTTCFCLCCSVCQEYREVKLNYQPKTS